MQPGYELKTDAEFDEAIQGDVLIHIKQGDLFQRTLPSLLSSYSMDTVYTRDGRTFLRRANQFITLTEEELANDAR